MFSIWAYCRVSTRKEEQEESLVVQRDRAAAFAKEKTAVLRLFEERMSARSITARPIILALLDELQSLPPRRRPKYIYVTALDRLYRNIADGMYIGQILREAKVSIYVAGRGEVTLDTFAKRAAFVGESLGGDAENEGRSKRALASWNRRRRAGAAMSNNRPYGLYFSQGADHIDPASAQWVRKAFEWYASGDGTFVISSRMRDGAPVQTWQTVRIGADGQRILKSRSVKAWDSNRVTKLLRLEAYRGTIVTPEIFAAVQERLAMAPRYDNERKFEYPLSGVMSCVTCGRHLHGGTSGAKKSKRLADGTLKTYEGVRQRYYRCVVCVFSVRADTLEKSFFADIGTLVADPALLKRWITPPHSSKTELVTAKKELRQLEMLNDPARVAKRRDQIFNLALASSIASEDFKEQMDREDSELEARSARCAVLTIQVKAPVAHQRSIELATSLLQRFAETYHQTTYENKRLLLTSLVLALGGLAVSSRGLRWKNLDKLGVDTVQST